MGTPEKKRGIPEGQKQPHAVRTKSVLDIFNVSPVPIKSELFYAASTLLEGGLLRSAVGTGNKGEIIASSMLIGITTVGTTASDVLRRREKSKDVK